MKLTVLPGTLSTALAVATSFIPAKHYLPALSCVLLEATPDGGLVMSGTNLESRSSRTVSAQVIEAGAVALPPDALRSFLEAVPPSEPITVSTGGGYKTELVCGKIRSRVPGIDPEQFPAAPSFDDPTTDITLGAAVLRDLIGGVAHAIAPDDSRPTLSGVLLRARGGTLTCVAADGLRLAIRSADVDESFDLDILPHGRALVKVAGTLDKATSARLLADRSGSMLQVDTEIGTWSMRLIDGQFPDYARILPKETRTVVSVDRDDILRATRLIRNLQVEVTGNGGKSLTVMARLVVSEDAIEITATDTTGDQEAEIVLPATLERGDTMAITLNGAYLRDAVEAIDGNRIALELTEPGKPALVRPATDDGDQLQVLVAMHDHRNRVSTPAAAPRSEGRQAGALGAREAAG